MAAADVLTRLRGMGLTLTAEGGNLLAGPKVAMTEEARSLIRAHKPDILRMLLASQADDLREHFEERAGILEYDAGSPRPEAEREATKITATYARNCGYQWASLRAALSAYPELLAALPEKAGPVDSLPLGVAGWACLPNGKAIRQGVFNVRRP